jgi:hypothetical protein
MGHARALAAMVRHAKPSQPVAQAVLASALAQQAGPDSALTVPPVPPHAKTFRIAIPTQIVHQARFVLLTVAVVGMSALAQLSVVATHCAVTLPDISFVTGSMGLSLPHLFGWIEECEGSCRLTGDGKASLKL